MFIEAYCIDNYDWRKNKVGFYDKRTSLSLLVHFFDCPEIWQSGPLKQWSLKTRFNFQMCWSLPNGVTM